MTVERLRGRTVVVTGGGSGIGRALARECARRGASRIAVLDVDDVAAAAAAAELDGRGTAYHCDVTDPDAVAAVADRVLAEHGVPGLVCANAGVTSAFAETLEEAPATTEWVFAVNVFGVLATLRSFATPMLESGRPGWLLVTGSEHGLSVPHVGLPAYTASKHALFAYCDLLHRELPEEVGLSVVCPSMVDTRLWDAGRNRPARFGPAEPADVVSRAVMGRAVDPAQVAAAALDGVAEGRFVILTDAVSAGPLERRRSLLAGALDQLDPELVRSEQLAPEQRATAEEVRWAR